MFKIKEGELMLRKYKLLFILTIALIIIININITVFGSTNNITTLDGTV